MKTSQVVRELEEAARELGVRVRREKGNFRGGYCVRVDEEILMLNRSHPPEVHLSVLAAALRELPIDSVYLRPAVRHALEEAWERQIEVEFEADEGD